MIAALDDHLALSQVGEFALASTRFEDKDDVDHIGFIKMQGDRRKPPKTTDVWGRVRVAATPNSTFQVDMSPEPTLRRLGALIVQVVNPVGRGVRPTLAVADHVANWIWQLFRRPTLSGEQPCLRDNCAPSVNGDTVTATRRTVFSTALPKPTSDVAPRGVPNSVRINFPSEAAEAAFAQAFVDRGCPWILRTPEGDLTITDVGPHGRATRALIDVEGTLGATQDTWDILEANASVLAGLRPDQGPDDQTGEIIHLADPVDAFFRVTSVNTSTGEVTLDRPATNEATTVDLRGQPRLPARIMLRAPTIAQPEARRITRRVNVSFPFQADTAIA